MHVDLNDLRGPSAAERSWTPAMAAAGPATVHLTGPAAQAAACDAMLTPVVTGQIDRQALHQLTGLWLTLHTHDHAPAGGHGQDRHDGQPTGDGQDPSGSDGQATGGGPGDAGCHGQDPGDSQASGDGHGGGQDPADRHRHGQASDGGQAPRHSHAPGPGTGHAPAAAGLRDRPAAWRPPGDGCRPPSRAGASTSSPAPAGSHPACAAPCSTPPSTPPASHWTSAAPPAPSRPTCAPPSSSATSTASSPAAGSPHPCAKCTT